MFMYFEGSPMTTPKSFRLDPYHVPVVLPQVSCVHNEVYFGGEFVASLTPAESQFLQCCDGKRTLAEIVRSTGADGWCVSRLARWFVWWDRAIAEATASSGVIETLVLSAGPHDAWLGMGGRLLLEPAQTATLVLMCFGSRLDTYHTEAFTTFDDVSIISRDEATLASRLGRLRQEVWEFPDFVSRNSVLSDHAPALYDTLRDSLLTALDRYRPQQVFMPAGSNGSEDARLLFEILFSLLVEGRLEADLHIYEDTPAAEGHRPVDEFLTRFESSYLAPTEYFVDVTESAHRKSSLLEVFHCRLSRSEREAWEHSAKRNALLAGFSSSHSCERFWKVDIGGLN
jgi:LmbE family N-acetylglucosaminyl deacetylase